jgi:hypothetical protein
MSYLAYIDAIVLLMGSNESDVKNAISVIRSDNQAVLVAGDIEYDPIVADETRAAIGGFDFGRTFPVGAQRFTEPGTQRLFRICVGRPFPKLSQCAAGNDSHPSEYYALVPRREQEGIIGSVATKVLFSGEACAFPEVRPA